MVASPDIDNFRISRDPIQMVGQTPGPHFDYRGDVMAMLSVCDSGAGFVVLPRV